MAAGPSTGGFDEDEGGFDDFPETHLGDEEYEEFRRKSFDSAGGERGDPPVTRILLWLIALLLLAAAALLL
jgi:hypothetical protein